MIVLSADHPYWKRVRLELAEVARLRGLDLRIHL